MKKKIIFAGLAAVMLVLASCKKSAPVTEFKPDYVAQAQAIAREIEEHGNEWDTIQWQNEVEKMFRVQLDFYRSMPSKELYDSFMNVQNIDWKETTSIDTRNVFRVAYILYLYDHAEMEDSMKTAQEELQKYWEKNEE